MMIEALVVLAGVALIVAVGRGHVTLYRAVRRVRRPRLAPVRWPSVTVIRPIRGVDVGLAENLAAALDADYPGSVETLFVLDDESDPSLPFVRRAIAQSEAAGRIGQARVLFAGAPPPGRTGKLNAMIAGMREAGGELIAFGDSDTRPDSGTLRELVARLLGSPTIGSAFAPVVVATPPRTIGDAGYALLINGLYGPAAELAAGRSGDMPFVMGQLMVFRRAALDAVGGLDCATGELVDDMHIGARLSAAGYRNRMGPTALPIVQQGLGLGAFLRLYRRWLLFARSGLPWMTFNRPAWIRGVELFAGLALVALAVASDRPALALLPGAALAMLNWSLIRLHRAVGGAPLRLRHLWTPLGLLFCSVFVLAATWLWPEVTWRGRGYRLGHDARLANGRGRARHGLIGVVLLGGLPVVAAPPNDVSAIVARGNELVESAQAVDRQQGVTLLLDAWRRTPERFEALVGASRAEFLRSGWAKEPQRAARRARHGWTLAAQVIRRWPDRAEGYYWSALNIGRYAQASGVLAAIEQGLAAKIEAMAEASMKRDPALYRFGAQRLLGCYYLRAPWPLHDAAKALAYLEQAHAASPDDAPGLLCLADALAETGNRARAARLYARCATVRGPDPDASAQCRSRMKRP